MWVTSGGYLSFVLHYPVSLGLKDPGGCPSWRYSRSTIERRIEANRKKVNGG